MRHGRPRIIEISVAARSDESISIHIKDNGVGLRADGRAGAYGIIGMQERVATLGGVLDVRNRSDGCGVIVTARLPERGICAPTPIEARQEAILR